jgi:hypothetical protein
MAFPGDRAWKLDRAIPSASLTGTPDYDGWVRLSEASFPDAALTAGGKWGIQNGGADIAASTDALGETRLAVHVVRCSIDATPANSRIELWVRYPALLDSADNPLWIWWGSSTEALPANDADYGRDDVWNGTTGGGTPPTAWAVYHFEESPLDSAPQIKDASGNGRDVGINSGTWSRAEGVCGRGWALDSGSPLLKVGSATSFSPGTGDFALLAFKQHAATGDVIFNALSSPSCFFRTYGASLNGVAHDWASEADGTFGVYARRNGTTLAATLNTSSYSQTHESFDYDFAFASVTPSVCSATEGVGNTFGFTAVLFCTPSVSWYRAWYDSITDEANFYDQSGDVQAASIPTSILFDGLQDGSQVWVFEEPHPQEWEIDCTGLDVATLDGVYFTFSVKNSGGTTDYYGWFDLDDGSADPAPAGTGVEIDVATGDTDDDIADAVQAALAAVTDLDAAIRADTFVTVTNERNGATDPPTAGTSGADVSLIREGGSASTEIDSISSSAGDWTADTYASRPRRVRIAILSLEYVNVRYTMTIQPGANTVPAGALQTEDRVYANPS